MTPLQLGSTLLQKYRIDRFRRRKDGVLLYEGVDASRLRRVCIKMLDRAACTDTVRCARFHEEAHGAKVIDIGTCEGLPYFVTTECELVPPLPRRSPVPPPLPKRASSKPPQLPKATPPPLPAIPIFVEDFVQDFVEEEVTVLQLPTAALAPPPPISSETLLPTAFEMQVRPRARASWLLFVAIVAITGVAGWYVGRAQSDIAAATQPAATSETPPPPPTTPPVVETVSAPPAIDAPAPTTPEPSSKPRARPKVDPLTI